MDQYSLQIYVILLNHSNMYNLYMCIYVHTHIYTHMYTSYLHNFIVYNYTYIAYIVYYIYTYQIVKNHFGALFDGSVQFSHSIMSDSLQSHALQHARPPCPSPAPGVYSNSCPLSQ